MQELWNLIGSPRHLQVFEAAARHESFTRAADELHIRQPAVSATIRQLESTLGVLLFQRSHKRVELTGAGQKLYVDVAHSLAQIAASAQRVRQLGRNDHVTLNASSAFGYYWMMPRLRDLRRSHPQIDLRLQSSIHEPDIDAENISLAIRRGSGSWPDCESALIAPEAICPIASPSFLARAGSPETLQGLLRQRLIHLEEPVRPRPGWQEWFAEFGINEQEPIAGLRLNDYALVLQAAIAGEGFALGWRHLTTRLVEQKLLVALEQWTWRSEMGMYLVWSRNRPLTKEAKHVRDWMLKSVG